MELCRICPRKCNIDRSQSTGFCREGDLMRISRISPHYYEEPPISYKNGSGTVFFSGCNLHCVFCQNKNISQGERIGKEYSQDELIDAIVALQESGVHNINLVTPTHYAEAVARVLERAKSRLGIPVVWNSGGYESVKTLRRLDGLVDIYLPDFKYVSTELSARYSSAPDYFEVASGAVREMYRQVGGVVLVNEEATNKNQETAIVELIKKGVIVRHLLLPGCRKDSIRVVEELAGLLPADEVRLSLNGGISNGRVKGEGVVIDIGS